MITANFIKSRIEMPELLELLGFEPNRAGYISCPAHKDKTPSLKIYENGKGWYCFSCNKGGSVIDFWMHVNHCDFQAAINGLADAFGLGGEMSKEDKMLLFRRKFKKTKKEQAQAERDYYRALWEECKRILAAPHDGWDDELEYACQKVAYAEYRMNLREEEENE